MKRTMFLLAGVCVCALLFAQAAAAQGKVAGTWEMTMQGRQGPMTQTLTFEQAGNNLKGTIKGQRGESPLEGTVDASKISFKVKRQTPNGEFMQEFNGTVDGDNIKGTVKMGENEREWTAKRSK